MRIPSKVVLGSEDHGGTKDLISEQVAAKEASIAVGEVEAFMEGNVGHVTEVRVKRVVLERRVVQVGRGVLVSLVLAKKLDDDSHKSAVRVGVGWGLEEGGDVEVGELIISHEHQRRCIVGLVAVRKLNCGSLESSEALVGRLDELAVVHVTGGSHDQVASSVVLSDELLDLVEVQSGGIFSDTEGWLAKLMVSEGSVVNILEGELHHVTVLVDDVSVYDLALGFELVLVE